MRVWVGATEITRVRASKSECTSMEESKREWERESSCSMRQWVSERVEWVCERRCKCSEWLSVKRMCVCVCEREREQERLRRVCEAERFSVCIGCLLESCVSVCVCVALLFFFTLLAWELKNDITILRSYDIRYVHWITHKIIPIIELKANDKDTAYCIPFLLVFFPSICLYWVRLYVAENSI